MNIICLIAMCLIAMISKEHQCAMPQIRPRTPAIVKEGEDLTTTCTYNDSETSLVHVDWFYSQTTKIRFFPNCLTFNVEAINYTSCEKKDDMIKITLTLDASQYKHDGYITCSVAIEENSSIFNVTTQVFVEVPVKTVDLTLPVGDEIIVIEDQVLEMKCTSEGRPQPIIDWFKQKYMETEIAIPGGNTTQTSELGTESVLLFYPNRTDNGYIVYCKAYHKDPAVNIESLHKILLNVLYKPDGPPTILNHNNNSHYNVIENTEHISTCLITGGNPIATIDWNCFDGSVILSHDDAVNSTLSWSASRKTDGRCECRSQHVLSNETVSFNVNVLYHPIYPTITYTAINGFEGTLQEIKIIEGSNATFTCSSDSNPPPSYYWSPGERQGQTLVVVDIKKDVNTINCTATNNMVPTVADPQNGSNTSSIVVEVLYPPSPPILTYFAETLHAITTDTIDVISGDSFSIECNSDGNPLPVYRWDHSSQANSTISIENIQERDNRMHICTSSNVMEPTSGVNVSSSTTAHISLNVMYKPSLPKLCYEHEQSWVPITSSTIRVIEQSPFTVKCDNAIGNPQDVIYHWQGNVAKNLTIHDINRNHSREYTCNVTNVMMRTFGDREIGHQSTSMTVDVLYPPRIKNPVDMQIEEGNILNVQCEITKGNPDNTMFSWLIGHTFISYTAVLEILNVTRNNSALYSCLVYNTLQPTFGTVENGSDFESFYLDVLYKSSIENFYAEKDGNKYSNITINENDAINLYCSVDSNPNSYIDISLEELQVAVTAKSKHLNHSIKSAACDDAGVYTCTGYNPHIMDQTKESTDVRLYVLCFPRASKPVNNITSAAQNTTVHFNATFVAYPVPRYKDYIWRKQQPDTSWVDLNTTDRIYITATNLQTYLTINNINRSDYGNFSLTVFNNVGKDYKQLFWLIPHEAPEKPKNVQVMILEINEILISWSRGFNGGFEQTFVIQLSTDEISWYNSTFDQRHNESSQQSWTILNDIDFDKTYYIRMFSFNIVGRSGIVTGPELNVLLKSADQEKIARINMAGIVGATFGGLAVLAIITGAIVICRRKTTSKTAKETHWVREAKTTIMACKCCCKRPSSNTSTANVYVNVAYRDNTEANPSGSQSTERIVAKRKEKRKTAEIEVLDRYHAYICNGKSVDISEIRALSMSIRQQPKKLEEQFKYFKGGKQFSTNAADKPTNRAKNRYKEIHPYDKNRIVLPVIKGNPESDYINASLIKGYGQNKYIASQAALENTLPDYWRMIWTQNVTQIVMLTNCIENDRLKCYKYWPSEDVKVYDNVTVRIVTEDVYSEYTIRVFNVCLIGYKGLKTVTQYHFTAWPDKDVPDTCVSLVQLWKMVKDSATNIKSPLMVHCSAGVGRTGTFLALDYLYDQGHAEGFVNFYECVVKLREQRMIMVQTVDQYAFLHHAVLEALDPIVEVCKTETFSTLRQRLLNPTTDSNSNKLKSEYTMIEAECHVESIPTVAGHKTRFAATQKRDEFADSKLPRTVGKSRNTAILPSDLYRPVLEMVVPGCGDYINAVVLSTYRFIDRMIITQVPLSHTIIDFLRMVWDFEVSTIVLLENEIPKNEMYWSVFGKQSFGIFEADVLEESIERSFVKRIVRYTVEGRHGKAEQKDVTILQFTAWKTSKLLDPKAMTSLIAELERKHVMTDPDAPFVVQCMDGATKSGLFCVLWSVLERMKFEREVAISETVRFLRTRRKQIIRDFDQYQYCYDLVQQYLDEFEVYKNIV